MIFLDIFFFEKIWLIFDIQNWLWKYNLGTFWQTIIQRRNVLKQFPLSMLIIGQKSCILGPTIFKIPQLNSALYKRRFQMGINPNVDHRLLRPPLRSFCYLEGEAVCFHTAETVPCMCLGRCSRYASLVFGQSYEVHKFKHSV